MSKHVTRSSTPAAKPAEPEPKRLHPAATTWNAFVRTMEEARLLWEAHKEAYLKHRLEIGEYSIETQKMLSGILHRQKFEFALDYMVKYSNSGYLPLIIE